MCSKMVQLGSNINFTAYFPLLPSHPLAGVLTRYRRRARRPRATWRNTASCAGRSGRRTWALRARGNVLVRARRLARRHAYHQGAAQAQPSPDPEQTLAIMAIAVCRRESSSTKPYPVLRRWLMNDEMFMVVWTCSLQVGLGRKVLSRVWPDIGCPVFLYRISCSWFYHLSAE